MSRCAQAALLLLVSASANVAQSQICAGQAPWSYGRVRLATGYATMTDDNGTYTTWTAHAAARVAGNVFAFVGEDHRTFPFKNWNEATITRFAAGVPIVTWTMPRKELCLIGGADITRGPNADFGLAPFVHLRQHARQFTFGVSLGQLFDAGADITVLPAAKLLIASVTTFEREQGAINSSDSDAMTYPLIGGSVEFLVHKRAGLQLWAERTDGRGISSVVGWHLGAGVTVSLGPRSQ